MLTTPVPVPDRAPTTPKKSSPSLLFSEASPRFSVATCGRYYAPVGNFVCCPSVPGWCLPLPVLTRACSASPASEVGALATAEGQRLTLSGHT